MKIWVYENSFNWLGVNYTPRDNDLEIEITDGELEGLETCELEKLNQFIQHLIVCNLAEDRNCYELWYN